MFSLLCTAVRDKLRLNLGSLNGDADNVDVQNSKSISYQLDGAPPGIAGQKFLAVYCYGWNPNEKPQGGISEQYDIAVCLSHRFPVAPRDRIADEILLKLQVGMESLLRQVNGLIHQQYDIIESANVLLATTLPDATDKFYEWLEWKGSTAQPEVKNGMWYGMDETIADAATIARPACLVMESYFNTGGRIQHNENYDE